MSDIEDDGDESEAQAYWAETQAAYKARIDRLEPVFRRGGVPFERTGWDDYDNSIELYGVAIDWRMPEEIQRAIAGEGFTRAFVNHLNQWETHYTWVGEFAPAKGWRVSYPHRRSDAAGDDGKIWVEAHVASWPPEWFEPSGSVTIKPTDGAPEAPPKVRSPE